MTQISQTVSVRLSAEHIEELDRRRLKKGDNRSDYLRELIIAALTNAPAEETRNRVAEVQDELKKLREDVWSATAILLANAGKATPEAAKKWVQNCLIK